MGVCPFGFSRTCPHPFAAGLPEAKQLQGYIRYVPPAAEEQDAAMEYDMDSDDEEWLAAYQQQLVSGSSRKTKRSRQEVKAGQQAAAAAVKVRRECICEAGHRTMQACF